MSVLGHTKHKAEQAQAMADHLLQQSCVSSFELSVFITLTLIFMSKINRPRFGKVVTFSEVKKVFSFLLHFWKKSVAAGIL